LQVTAFQKCHLLSTPLKDLQRYIQWAWQEQLLMQHTQRAKLYNLPPVDKIQMAKILQKYTPKQQLLLLREIAGAFQTGDQKARWTENTDSICAFCGCEGDTRQHRTFTCNAFAQIRLEHQDYADELFETDPDFVELPAIFMHPHYEFYDELLRRMPIPEISQETCVRILQTSDSPCFYTDGSCKYPTCPSTCYSAFAVVADLSTDDVQRCNQADVFRSTGIMPATLQTIATGRTQGRQLIHRAELSAMALVFETFATATVYTDSSTAISLINRCRRAQCVEDLMEHDDIDLLSRIFRVLTANHQVRKVKAHQNPVNVFDALLRFHALGNTVADTAANYACVHLLPEVVQQLEDKRTDLLEQQEKLRNFFNLNLDLQHARAKATSIRANDENIVTTPVDVKNLLCNWTVHTAWEQPTLLNDHELVHSVWGYQWAVALLEWVQSCRWPAEEVQGDPGISWTEIAICLMLQQGQWLPVKRLRGDHHLILQANSPQDLKDLQPTLSELSTTVYNLMNQLQGLVLQAVLPQHCRFGKCKSLYLQGYHAWTTGLSCRPAFSQQTCVFNFVHNYVAAHSGLDETPKFQIPMDGEMWIEDMQKGPFAERVKASRAAMLRVRKRRKEIT